MEPHEGLQLGSSNFVQKYKTKGEVTNNNKHSSLLQLSTHNGRKIFYDASPCNQSYELILELFKLISFQIISFYPKDEHPIAQWFDT